MLKELWKNGESLIRVLKYEGDEIIVLDCMNKTLPFKVNKEYLSRYKKVDEDIFNSIKGKLRITYDLATQKQKNEANKIFGTISLLVSCVDNIRDRSKLINICAEANNLTTGTIRTRLYKYLLYQDLGVFIIENNKKQKSLTSDERNFRWALNKYYYNPLKISLIETYRRMIKDTYLDENGIILEVIPTFRQFKYYYEKTMSLENLLISRNGKGDFMRNERALLGNGVKEFCPTIGYGMFDSTICDIYLINDNGELVGRPVMVACVDGYSSMCLGYWLGFEGGIKSLRGLIKNLICDKVKWCKKFGIEITRDDWNVSGLPRKFITDKGREYISETFSQLTELGIEIMNLPPYRPELKSRVEKFFDLIQSSFKKELASKGVIFPDFQERGGVDYRKKAALTLDEFEKIILLCINKYNTGRLIDLPYDKVEKVKPFANSLWNYCLQNNSNSLINVSDEILELTLLPRTKAKFKRDGLNVNKLRYRNFDYIDSYLKGSEVIVAYDPDNVSKVWLIENGTYVEFELIDDYFLDKTVDEVNNIINTKDENKTKYLKQSLQANVDLSKKIERAISTIKSKKINIKNIKKHRREEVEKR